MPNPFDDPSDCFLVLVNASGEHSLVPVAADVPAGWDVAFGEGTRAACLAFVESR